MPLKIVGLDVFRAGYIQPGLIPVATDRLDTLRPDALFMSPRRNVPRRHEGRHASLPGRARGRGVARGGETGSAGNQRLAVMDIAGHRSRSSASGC
jgi:putative ABC transport system permease protein